MSAVPSIKRLDESVVNRIAAGEVIQRPANALKELLENSLDAKATSIQVTVKQGGLKLLHIQDNGTGIRKEDLSIVCERFTTSKLTKFEDLSNIATYGFRGEALASISHVAQLTLISKTADSPVGYKATYSDSKLKGPPKACAANDGTQIIVENLFFNIPMRRKALKNPSEEYAKILDVVGKYAVHNSKIGFSLKKQGENISDIKTPQDSNVVDNISNIFGYSVAKELLEIAGKDDILKLEFSGQISNVTYNNKKLIFLLFINNRLVDSSGLRRIIEQIYSMYLPKNSHPFVYISIHLDPHNVDVNIHPTKHEVHFLHEDAIIDKVRSIIEDRLKGSNTSRAFYTQVKLPLLYPGDVALDSKVKDTITDRKEYPFRTVRTDSSDQKLDKFFSNSMKSKTENSVTSENKFDSFSNDLVVEKRAINITSFLKLRTEVKNQVHSGLHEIIKNCTLVGFIDVTRCLLQHDTKLYLCNTKNIIRELIYQIVIFESGNLGIIRFSEPIPLKSLMLHYLDLEESGWIETDGPKEELAENMAEFLKEKSKMLDDYFSIEIDSGGNLRSIPLIVDKYVPDTGYLPRFVTRICSEVDWNLEKPCLEGIARELSKFYCEMDVREDDTGSSKPRWMWTSEHVLLAAMKKILLPPTNFSQDGTVLEIADLPDLYKVFERC